MKERLTPKLLSANLRRVRRLAAAELQAYVAKISGGRLPIRAECSVDVPVQIYVGESKHAAKLPRGLLKARRFVIHGMSRYYNSGNAVSYIMGD